MLSKFDNWRLTELYNESERYKPTNSEGHANPLKTKPEQLLDD